MEVLNSFYDIFNDIVGLLKFIALHVVEFVEFVLSLPSFILDLVNFIPEPLKSISESFVIFIILIIVITTSAKIISSVKGG